MSTSRGLNLPSTVSLQNLNIFNTGETSNNTPPTCMHLFPRVISYLVLNQIHFLNVSMFIKFSPILFYDMCYLCLHSFILQCLRSESPDSPNMLLPCACLRTLLELFKNSSRKKLLKGS